MDRAAIEQTFEVPSGAMVADGIMIDG